MSLEYLQYLITTYGYFAILIGTFIEGETVLILGGLCAQLGYLELRWVILFAFLGGMAWDQALFFSGRLYGNALLGKFPRLRPKVDKVLRLIERYRTPIIVVIPFLHGFREISPIAIGMSRVPTLQFVLLNGAAVIVWAFILGLGGYLFGHALEAVIGDIKRYQTKAIFVLLIIAALVWLIIHIRSLLRRKPPGTIPEK